ncbi:pro-resilin-like isoform X2 [Macrobrachium rosenbergii]|uniref:pro-resilin-like isoform X2 n=1 Tax=Macrobrachium rosenbergii TaxID=79674 RepID=UPI0034D512A0
MKIAVAFAVALLGSTCQGAPQGYNYAAPTTPAPASYSFSYAVDAADSLRRPVLFGQEENRQGVQTTGTYYVLLPDSRLMTVNYYVDETGFHPTYTFQGQAVYPEPAAVGGQAALAAPSQLYNTPVGGQAALATPSQLYNTPVGK